METIKVQARINAEGLLKLEIPTGLAEGDVEIVLVVNPKAPVDALGWPVGFFERTYGALADDPIERPPQPPLETREPLE